VAAPVTSLNGYARAQAALLVTGRRSYTTLERVGYLQGIVADESLDEALRRLASTELDLIGNGGSVASAHRRIKTQLAFAELEQLAADAEKPAGIHQEASAGVSRVHAAEHTRSDIELEQLAREALSRAKTATKAKRTRAAVPNDSKLPVRSFVFLWNDLHEWWLHYDSAEIVSELTDEQWEQFEATLAGTIAFAERMRSLRDASPAVALVSTRSLSR
jgi:ParB family chromosome partitioning protein